MPSTAESRVALSKESEAVNSRVRFSTRFSMSSDAVDIGEELSAAGAEAHVRDDSDRVGQ